VLVAYWICFLLGLGYAVIAALMSGLLGFGEGAEGGVDAGVDGGVDAGADAGGEVALSPWSPMTLAMFITCFGGVGVILTKMGLPIWFTVPPAALSGAVVAGLVFLFLLKVFMAIQGSSEATVANLVGREAEVITPIGGEGLGEIAYVARGTRYTAPARSETGEPISRYAVVRIVKIVGSTFHVRKAVEEELRSLSAEEMSEPTPPKAAEPESDSTEGGPEAGSA